MKYFLSFRTFEQLALDLKTEFALIFFKPRGAAFPPDPPPRMPLHGTNKIEATFAFASSEISEFWIRIPKALLHPTE